MGGETYENCRVHQEQMAFDQQTLGFWVNCKHHNDRPHDPQMVVWISQIIPNIGNRIMYHQKWIPLHQ